MSSVAERIKQLEAAIAAQELLRPTLGEAIVEAALAALRGQLAALRAEEAAGAGAPAMPTPEQALAHLQAHLPEALAEKARAHPTLQGERKLVTVLFADLSGFTSLSERLDPELIQSFLNDLFGE